MRRYGLRDDQWDRIKVSLPGGERHVGVTAKDNRLFVEAVLFRYRAGVPWRDLPERFGSWKTVHTPVQPMGREGCWGQAVRAPERRRRQRIRDDRQHHGACPSAQCGCAQKNGADQAIGRSKGGLNTKIHALFDALGNPIDFLLSPGQAHDLLGANAFLPDLVADTLLAAANKVAVIPSKSNRKVQRQYDKELYKARHLIENFLCKLKQFRALQRAMTRPRETSSLASNSPQATFASIEDTP